MGRGGNSGNRRAVGRTSQVRRGALLAVLFSLIASLVLIKLNGGENTLRQLAEIDLAVLAAGLALVVLTWIIDGFRMKVLVQALGGRLGIVRATRISVLGAFISNVTPFDSGGEPFQVYLLTSPDFSTGQATAVVAVKTIINALARVILGMMAGAILLFSGSTWSLSSPLRVAVISGISIYVSIFGVFLYLVIRPECIPQLIVPAIRNKVTLRFFRREAIDKTIEHLNRELGEFRQALDKFVTDFKVELAKVMLFSLACWLSTALVPALVLRGLGYHGSVVRVMAVTVIFYLAAAYAPTPGSSGAAELGFAALFSTIAPRAVLGLFVMVWRMITYYFSLIVGGALMALGMFHPHHGADAPPSPCPAQGSGPDPAA